VTTDFTSTVAQRKRSGVAMLLRLRALAESKARIWNTTPSDRAIAFPCDRYVRKPQVNSYRAIEIEAPAELVYRWLCQLRIAPYSYDRIDNYHRRSPRRLTPGAEQLRIGQRWFIKIFELVEFEPGRQITLQIGRARWFWGPDVGATYLLVPHGPNSCRLVVAVASYANPGILGELRRNFYPWGELLMMTKQLRTFKELAESEFHASQAMKPSAWPIASAVAARDNGDRPARDDGDLPSSVGHLSEDG
jgi:hypothetical protein